MDKMIFVDEGHRQGYIVNRAKGQRKGQAWFNALHPHVADMLHGSRYDTFYVRDEEAATACREALDWLTNPIYG